MERGDKSYAGTLCSEKEKQKEKKGNIGGAAEGPSSSKATMAEGEGLSPPMTKEKTPPEHKNAGKVGIEIDMEEYKQKLAGIKANYQKIKETVLYGVVALDGLPFTNSGRRSAFLLLCGAFLSISGSVFFLLRDSFFHLPVLLFLLFPPFGARLDPYYKPPSSVSPSFPLFGWGSGVLTSVYGRIFRCFLLFFAVVIFASSFWGAFAFVAWITADQNQPKYFLSFGL